MLARSTKFITAASCTAAWSSSTTGARAAPCACAWRTTAL